MDTATPTESAANFKRFQSWEIRPEEEYARRMRILSELVSATEGTCARRFWNIMGQVVDWEWENMNLALWLTEKIRTDQGNVQRLPLATVTCCQSPPPGKGIEESLSGSVNFAASQSPPTCIGIDGSMTGSVRGAASSSIPPPSTPPELVNNSQKVLSKEQAEIVAKNKAAAFLMREAKRASEKQKREAEVFEAMQWHA